MKLQILAILINRTARMMYRIDIIRRTLGATSVRRVFYIVLRLIREDIIKGNLNGVRLVFYNPRDSRLLNFSPETYGASPFVKPFYEHSVIMHLGQITKQYDSPTFLDVGAHYGYFTIYMSKLGGGSSKVFSFEPNGEYFEILSTNVRLNKLQNVFLHKVALSDKTGTIAMEASQHFRSIGFQQRRKMKLLGPLVSSSEEQVSAVPFDKLAQSLGISPKIVKIDVHGAEGNVVSGMKNTLRKHVEHLYCELHDE
ncbi:MAG: FkbM family methyltransferase, partial [Candidatus Bathyarchaeia archaeon]